jgi:uncharacterized membrane protein YhaH (DUF805 family)
MVALLGIMAAVVFLCILAVLWSTGVITTRRFNFRGRYKSHGHEPPQPRATGVN